MTAGPTTTRQPRRLLRVAVRYVLADGRRGTLLGLQRSTADAVLLALDTWGAALRTCSARVLP
jgi:hypothetical protein